MVLNLKIVLLLLLFLNNSLVWAQPAGIKYVVTFSGKDTALFNEAQPIEYLSQRAIDRRIRQGIAITPQDYPVNHTFISELKHFNLAVMYTSRWFNSAVIATTVLSVIDSIRLLPFVTDVKRVSGLTKSVSQIDKLEGEGTLVNLKSSLSSERYNYGDSWPQIQMLKGNLLHNQGFTGKGMVIAILDAGFTNANNMSAFDSVRDSGRLFGTHNFWTGTSQVYEASTHGASVWSIIAANLPGKMIGAAPDASFWLLKTEVTGTENLVETENWIAAAEFADSAGADIISSSLGYYKFDDVSMNFLYSQMDGKTTRISRAAQYASDKGILVVNSAGNEGDDPWKHIVAPADADGVLSVGAVNGYGFYAPFSSTGPTSDGRIKPDVVAQGAGTVYVTANDETLAGSGTSFSAPLISGMAACLWQAFPMLTAGELKNEILKSASAYFDPNDSIGFGLPDFGKVYKKLSEPEVIRAYPVPFINDIEIEFYPGQNADLTVQILDCKGITVYTEKYLLIPGKNNQVLIRNVRSLNRGLYFIRCITNTGQKTIKVIKN